MNVILIVIHRLEPNQWIVFRDLRQLLVKIGKNSVIEYFLSVFCNQYYVIIAMVDTMRKVSQFHPSYITPKKMQGELHPSTLRSGN